MLRDALVRVHCDFLRNGRFDDVCGIADVRPARHVHDGGHRAPTHGTLVRRPREHELPALTAQAAVAAVQQHLRQLLRILATE